MKTRKLGSQGLEASAQGLGCMGMSAFYGDRDDGESTKTIDRALELGVTLLDTAEMYGPHANEELLGAALEGRDRDSFVLATKFGIKRDMSADPPTMENDGTPENVRDSIEGSLRRLRTRPRRSLLPAPRRPRCPRSRRPSARWASWSPRARSLPRPLRGGARHDPQGTRDPPDQRRPDRVLAVDPRARGERRARHLPRARHRLRRLQPAGPRLPQREDPRHRHLSTRTTTGGSTRASRATTSSPTSRSSRPSRRWPTRAG